MKHLCFKRNSYQDSFNLMLLANQVQKFAGVNEVALLMGTGANQQRLQKVGYSFESVDRVNPSDLVIALDCQSEDVLQAALQQIELFLADGRVLAGEANGTQAGAPRSLESAVRLMQNPDLVSISLPGEYAGQEARNALKNGLHVFLFSDNVSVDEEVNLKRMAWENGLLLMGPDCGTARIGGYPLGFCNVVKNGEVGIVAASGTGAQEVMTLLDRMGIGISHVIGTGGRDLHRQVGARTSLMGIFALEADPNTKVIVYISKPADHETRKKLIGLASTLTKPLVICLIGEKYREQDLGSKCVIAANLDHAAQLAASLLTKTCLKPPMTIQDFSRQHQKWIAARRAELNSDQKYVRGLFSGGSLADEAALILAQTLPEVHCGNGFGEILPIADWEKSSGTTIVDLGDDRFTQGRPHPMIDFRSRLERLRYEAQDPSVAVILVDLVLGLNAHPNPAPELAQVIAQTRAETLRQNRNLIFLVHLCGTDQDPQGYSEQQKELEKAGCWVFESNVKAAMAAACLAAPRLDESRDLG